LGSVGENRRVLLFEDIVKEEVSKRREAEWYEDKKRRQRESRDATRRWEEKERWKKNLRQKRVIIRINTCSAKVDQSRDGREINQ
jgi:hypothetical protein